MPSEAEIAWAAGLFEGEGHFTVNRQGGGRWLYLQMGLTNTDLELVERFAEVVGLGTINGPMKPSGMGKKEKWVWRAMSQEALTVALTLSPWLSQRRLARLQEIRTEVGL